MNEYKAWNVKWEAKQSYKFFKSNEIAASLQQELILQNIEIKLFNGYVTRSGVNQVRNQDSTK